MSGETALKESYFFSHSTTSSYGVVIGYLGNKKFSVNKICKGNNGRVLIIEAETFNLLNLYYSNSETEQLQTLSEVNQLLSRRHKDHCFCW